MRTPPNSFSPHHTAKLDKIRIYKWRSHWPDTTHPFSPHRLDKLPICFRPCSEANLKHEHALDSSIAFRRMPSSPSHHHQLLTSIPFKVSCPYSHGDLILLLVGMALSNTCRDLVIRRDARRRLDKLSLDWMQQLDDIVTA